MLRRNKVSGKDVANALAISRRRNQLFYAITPHAFRLLAPKIDIRKCKRPPDPRDP